LEGDSSSYELRDGAEAIQTLNPTPEQVEAVLRPALDAVQETNDFSELRVLAQAIQALGPTLTPDQAEVALGAVLDAFQNAGESREGPDLAKAVQTLSVRIPSERAQVAFGWVLGVIHATTSRYSHQALASAIQTLGAKLQPEQARDLLGPVLDAIGMTADPDQLRTLVQAVQTLDPKLNPEAAQTTLRLVLNAIQQTTDSDQLQALGQAVQALGTAVEQREPAILLARRVLATTDAPKVAAAFAGALAALLSAKPPRRYVAEITELLKWPTAAGPATDVLLEALHERVSDAPGKEAGLDATVAWVAATYPDIDLDSPPTFPASGSTGGGW
jgi:ribosomal protein S7